MARRGGTPPLGGGPRAFRTAIPRGKGGRRAATLVEMLIVVLLVAVVLGALLMVMSRVFAGTRKGYDTLSVLQEEARFVTFLKHDLRTMIIPDGLPPPVVTDDAAGLTEFSFHKVDLCDQYGKPIPVRITYRREGGTRQVRHLDGTLKTVYTFLRTDGTTSRTFMEDMVSSLSLRLLDAGGQPAAAPAAARKARLAIGTCASELLQVTVSIYSPYLAPPASSPEAVWLPNHRMRGYAPGAGITTYGGVAIPAADLDILGAAIALTRERGL